MKNESINQHFAQAHIILQNARQHTVIQQCLTDWGYSLQQIGQAETLLSNAQQALQTQKETYHLKLDCDRQWRNDWAAFQQSYSEHRSVAKIAFRHEPDLLRRLRLDHPIPKRITNLIDQAADFYRIMSGKSKEVQKFGIKAEEITQAQTMITSLTDQQARRMQCKGDAESATQQRNQALADLRAWQREFIRIAKMALKDNPQLLEVLGVVVA